MNWGRTRRRARDGDGGDGDRATEPEVRMAAYVAGELAGAERAAFERELAGDPALAALARDLAAVGARVRATPDAPPCRDLADAVLARLPPGAFRESTGEPRRAVACPIPPFTPGWWLRMAAALAAAALGGGLFYAIKPVLLEKAERERVAGNRARAVADAAEWLAGAQDASGAWDAVKWGGKRDYEISLTAMSLLALAGPTPDAARPRHDAIRRAAAYLVSRQNSDGSFGPAVEGLMYNHGIATVALLHARESGATRDASVRRAADAALAFVCRAQSAVGGWGYRPGGGEPNTSVSVWQIEALRLGARAGRAYPDHNLQRGLRWLASLARDNGTFGYRSTTDTEGSRDALTAMGAYCVLTAERFGGLDRGAVARIRLALDRVAAAPTPGRDFYENYFVTAALRTGRDRLAARLLDRLEATLLGRRAATGPNRGSWDPADRWGAAGGRLYSTALAALSLQKPPS
jgi:anti-sigma factor RsiW